MKTAYSRLRSLGASEDFFADFGKECCAHMAIEEPLQYTNYKK